MTTLTNYTEQTYAVFGDVHAHIKPMVKTLERLGWNAETLVIPKNLTIVQAGDLIHKGPQTNEIIALVDGIMERNNGDPDCGTWIQLMGNHESQYFEKTFNFWRVECSKDSGDTLRRWVEEGKMLFSYLIPQRDRPYMVSHAGVNPFWYYRAETLFNAVNGGPVTTEAILTKAREDRTPENFVAWLNSLTHVPYFVSRPGVMLRGGISSKAGPVWAESVREVYVQWRDGDVPFHQIHGHVTPVMWGPVLRGASQFYPTTPEIIRKEIEIFPKDRRTLWRNTDGAEFHCIDNGFDKFADLEHMRPLLLTEEGIIPFKI
ncbi:MAG: metallophosphoesterase [Enterococcus sp.]|nr:metallophosphoesterase [Enterococcus sp.]